jgi:two-component system nitrogen regulation sensor histidine kinase NtrY
VTLAQRLLVAIGVLTVAITLALGLAVRAAWRSAEERSFDLQFGSAIERLKAELAHETDELSAVTGSLCEDSVLDQTLVGMRAGTLETGDRLKLSVRADKLKKAHRFDELVLVTGRGEILGGGPVGTTDPALAAEIRKPPEAARVRTEHGKLALVASCTLSSGSVTLGLVGARWLDSVLERVGTNQGLTLSFEAPADTSRSFVRTMQVPELPGVTIVATLSREPFLEATGQLDRVVLVLGIACFAGGLVLAFIFSKQLAEPIESLSEQARRVVAGDPVPIKARGGRELEEFARSFNRAISDLVALRKRLAATERIAARREIARQVAHEIKNPLAPIRAAVETLRRLRARNDPAFDEYFDEASRTVLDEVARITSIVQEFTRFARLPPPNPAAMDLARAVRDLAGLHAAAGTPIDVTAAPIPSIVGDRDQLVQVVTNLLGNATDAVAAKEGGRVGIELGPAGPDRVRLSVRDNGPGVAPEIRERLFEPYATTKPEGTGLGLAIAQRIVVEHGGEISYADAPDGGAVFVVELPVAGPAFLPEAPPSSNRPAR